MHAPPEISYAGRLAQERRRFDGVSEFDDLPPIYHYWSNTFVRAMLERSDCRSAPTFSRQFLRQSALRSEHEKSVFLSIGSGDGNNEVEIAQLLHGGGLEDFRIECLELNPNTDQTRGRRRARAGLSSHSHFLRGDFNRWRPRRRYDGVVANQSLHHVTNLEGLFDAVRDALAPGAFFVANDIIGRNGHQRWPEAQPHRRTLLVQASPPAPLSPPVPALRRRVRRLGLLGGRLRRHPRARRSPAADRALFRSTFSSATGT